MTLVDEQIFLSEHPSFSSEGKLKFEISKSVDSSDVEPYSVDPGLQLMLFRKFCFLCIYNITLFSVFKSLSSMIGEIENTDRTQCTGLSSRKQAKRC